MSKEKESLELDLEELENRIKTLEKSSLMNGVLITSIINQLKDLSLVQSSIASQVLTITDAFTKYTESAIDYEYLSFEDDGTYN